MQGQEPQPQPEEPRLRWQKTKAAVEQTLRSAPQGLPGPGKTETRAEYARLVLVCVRDIEDQPARFTHPRSSGASSQRADP